MNLEINRVDPVRGMCHLTCPDVYCGRLVDDDEAELVR
jgi:hypothetical protein